MIFVGLPPSRPLLIITHLLHVWRVEECLRLLMLALEQTERFLLIMSGYHKGKVLTLNLLKVCFISTNWLLFHMDPSWRIKIFISHYVIICSLPNNSIRATWEVPISLGFHTCLYSWRDHVYMHAITYLLMCYNKIRKSKYARHILH